MTVTLEWLLDRPDLGLRLVTDVPTAQEVTWAHAIDVGDPTPWLNGGELVLTTGLRLARSAREQRAYVEGLADCGVAGIGFGVGIRYDEIPVPIVDACAERGVPLVEVPLPTPFIAITQAVARRLSEQELESLQEALTHQRRITRAAVRGGLTGLVGVLDRELHCDPVVLDEYGAVMASSTRDSALIDLVGAQWRRLSREAHGGAVGIETQRGTLEIQSLRGRSAVVGWLAVHHHTPPTATDRLLLNQAAGLITLQLDWPAELVAAYHALGGTLLDLLLHPGQQAGSLVRHLHHFGFAPTDPVMLAVVKAPRSRPRLLQVVSDQLESSALPHVVTRLEGGVAALLRAQDTRHLVEVLASAAEEAGMGRVVIGVSGSLPQADVATAIASAEQAAASAQRARRSVGWFDELTLGAVVEDETVRSRIWTLAGPALDALERGATAREADLVPSLEAFLHHNGSWETAARALGVHRHTLRARMARVEELTGLTLDSAETRVLLLLALMSRPGGPAPSSQ
ncbi:PucR family transcriptional regulator [Nocardioides ungokensis]|uniref:PucR family transcriptional regulator n=1 Tax=Nocardioides ungokensis TaxID=1643322 RepID=UPI0015DE6BDF|nr:PucR family transcriptional regulator ligand-binding domain-containing protein [Nocardioides ungokensis]